MEINYQKLVFRKLWMDSYKAMQKFTNHQYRPSHAQTALCYVFATATWLLNCDFILLHLSDFFLWYVSS